MQREPGKKVISIVSSSSEEDNAPPPKKKINSKLKAEENSAYDSGEIPLSNRNYELTFELLPEGEPMEYWTIAFSSVYRSLFAAPQANLVHIFELKDRGFKQIAVVEEKLRAEEEAFFSVTWTECGPIPLLVASGKTGRILVFELKANDISTKHSLLGHGAEVNDLKTHPHRPGIIASASADFSVRLWNVISGVCIAVFGGHRGHRDEVNAVSFPILSDRIVCAGADNRISIWDLSPLKPVLDESFTISGTTERASQPKLEQFPEFSTSLVHDTAVDDIAFVGDLVASKGTDERIVLWKPMIGTKGIAAPLFSLSCAGNKKTWMRFGLDTNGRIIAVGDNMSSVLLWDLEEVNLSKNVSEKHRPHRTLSGLKNEPPRNKKIKPSDDFVVSKIAFNWDANTFIVATIGGILRRYDDTKRVPSTPSSVITT